MKRNILPNDCKAMFNDRLNDLSMRDIGIELKHFSIGTAPEYPSFLVNQDVLKNTLIEQFMVFFDFERSQGLEVMFLKSNYGNGKSHFIRTIYSFLNNFENVFAKKVSLKQDKTDLKFKVLEGVGQKNIKDSATYFVDAAAGKASSDEKDAILLHLSEDLDINSALSELIYEAARNEDISKQSQAVALLKGNFLPGYLKSFNLKRGDLDNTFYFDVIRLVCDYLHENDCYIVIMFDEYEHIYSWKDEQARKVFFGDIKLFMDCIDTYKNLFFVFAESESVNSGSEFSDDPAYVSRKKGRTYQIANISSKVEVQNLFKLIKDRYEKYYEISLNAYVNEMLESINANPQVKTNSNYRNYTQVIMRILDQYRNKPPEIKQSKKEINSDKNFILTINKTVEAKDITLKDKWIAATSISKKSILCDAIEYVLDHSNERIISKSKKRGLYQTQKQEEKINYYIISTDKPSSSDFIKRYNNILRIKEESGITKSIILYPYKKAINNEFKYENVIFYDVFKIPMILESIYSNSEIIGDVLSYLIEFEARC